jgi:hypothetical protein
MLSSHGIRRSAPLLVVPLVALFVTAANLPLRAQDDSAAQASTKKSPPQIVIDDDGTYHLPAQAIPMSKLMSKELKDSLIYIDRTQRDPKYTAKQPDGSTLLLKPFRDRQDALFPLNRKDTKIGGIHVIVYTPKEGVSPNNKSRVLIELHSADCWTDCGALGSQPVAFLGKIEVVSVDYLEPAFPDGVVSVASVYSELLKSHKPANIGIYGCSRGGELAARSLAWFQRHNLPRPAAVGMLCASAGGDRGDAIYVGGELGNGSIPHPAPPGQAERDLGKIDPNDPMVNPVNFPEVLSKFPPSLLITGTRSIDLSTGAYTHEMEVKLGVESEFHVFEGGRHSFWYDPAPPESRQVYDIIVKFFDRHLGVGN